MTEIESAEKTLARLQDKRDRAAARVQQIAAERKQIGFAAHADGDVKAKKRLAELNADDANMAGELQSLDAAIAEASTRLAKAQHLAATAADRARAHRAREAFAQFVAAGLALDDAFAAVTKQAAIMEQALDEAHTLGCTMPSNAQFATLGELAVQSSLMQTPWARGFRHLAPHERHSFAALVRGWQASAAPAIEARLAEQTNEKAA